MQRDLTTTSVRALYRFRAWHADYVDSETAVPDIDGDPVACQRVITLTPQRRQPPSDKSARICKCLAASRGETVAQPPECAMNLSLYLLTVLIWGTTWLAITYQLGPGVVMQLDEVLHAFGVVRAERVPWTGRGYSSSTTKKRFGTFSST